MLLVLLGLDEVLLLGTLRVISRGVSPPLESRQAINSGKSLYDLCGVDWTDTSHTHSIITSKEQCHSDKRHSAQPQLLRHRGHLVALHELALVENVLVH